MTHYLEKTNLEINITGFNLFVNTMKTDDNSFLCFLKHFSTVVKPETFSNWFLIFSCSMCFSSVRQFVLNAHM